MEQTSFFIPLLISILVILLTVSLFFLRTRQSRDPTILLTGYKNAGKTTLFYRLKTNQFRSTLPSLQSNSFQLDKTKFVDLPGHPKLFQSEFQKQFQKSTPTEIWFLLDAQSIEWVKHGRHAAESLYSILSHKEVMKYKVKVKIIFTKNDVPLVLSQEQLKLKLQQEMEQIRNTSGQSMTLGEEEEEASYLGYEGKAFEFEDLENDIEFLRISSLSGDNVQKLI